MSSSSFQNRLGKSSIFTARSNRRFAGPLSQTLSPLTRNFVGTPARCILVVEDNQLNCELLRDWLAVESYEVWCAADLKASYEVFFQAASRRRLTRYQSR
jgi:hypothetical protein